MKPKPPPPEASPQDEADADFARALGGVAPLGGRARIPTQPPRAAPAAPAPAPAPSAAARLAIDEERVEGRAGDLDPRLLRRLRRGDPPAERELDLHGLHRDNAEREVARFVQSSADGGCRVVRIIPGRGLHSESGPVLRRELARWLAAPRCEPFVLAFVQAPANAGGEGAVHVLLRPGKR